MNASNEGSSWSVHCVQARLSLRFSTTIISNAESTLFQVSKMSLCPENVLITGANRGIGLEFVKQFAALPKPPVHVFAGCRTPDQAKVPNFK